MGRMAGLLALLAVCLLLLAACSGTRPPYTADDDALNEEPDPPRHIHGVRNLTKIAQLTGPDSINRTDKVAVAGTDLGSMINTEERTYFVFGDTFGEREPEMTGGGGTNWRSNTLAWSTDTDPSDGISFDGWATDEIGLAAELLPSKKRDFDEMTKIPTSGFVVGDTLYLCYMSVRHWGEPGEWEANHAGLGKSGDQGRNWTLLDSPRWPGDSNFIQVSPYQVGSGDSAEIYFFAIPAGRSGGVQLMKVPTGRVESPRAYRYFTGVDDSGKPTWGGDPEQAETVIEGGVGEPSVIWNRNLGSWLITHQRDNADVVIRESPTPWGPWSEPTVLVSAAEYPGLYAPFMNPRFVQNDGRRIYFTLSLWEPYNVFWFRADLVGD